MALLPTSRRAKSFKAKGLQAAASNPDWAEVQAPDLTVSYSKQST